MKNAVGTICFVVLGLLVFRLVYGAWPPFEGKFGEWLASDPRAGWSMVAGILCGIVGALVGRAFVKDGSSEASECARRGFVYHKQRRLQDAIDMFRRAIKSYTDDGRINDAAPVYASLGKVYFDNGDLDPAEEALQQALTIYRRRSGAQEAITTILALLDLIAERRQKSDKPSTYTNAQYGFSFVIPAGWLK